MKKILLTVLAFLAISCPVFSFGGEIEIKGISLGMSKEKFEKDIGIDAMNNFTIAGATSKYPLHPDFFENKLDMFNFIFDSDKFEDVLSAVKSKYPEIKCKESEVSNAMGAHFQQVNCEIRGDSGSLSITRIVNNINTSSINLMSDRFLKEFAAKKKNKQNDI